MQKPLIDYEMQNENDTSKIQIQMHDLQYTSYYFFINKKSGNQQGKKIIDLQINQLLLSNQCLITICDIYDQQFMSNIYQQIKDKQNNQKFHIIVGGGDGSLSSTIDYLQKYQINPYIIPVTIIPFGTGNDLSRSLGWGSKVNFDNGFNFLKQQSFLWKQTEIEPFDIWNITIDFFEGGKILTPNKQIIELQSNLFQKMMTNYLSIGQDARVTYGFEPKRKASRFMNNMIYAFEGVKKQIFQKNPNTSDLFEDFVDLNQNQIGNQQQIIINKFKKKQKCLNCYNIGSYMGGTKNIWKNSKQGVLLIKDKGQEYKKQSHSDGLLEIVQFSSVFKQSFEMVIGGNGNKFHQGSGPFIFNFKQIKPITTHIQIDGEGFKIFNPKQIKIERINSMQILVKNKNKLN